MTNRQKIGMTVVLVAMFHLLLVVVFGDNGLVELSRNKAALSRLVDTNTRLAKENLQYYQSIDRLKTDPQFVENVARQELGMVAPNEVVFQFGQKAGEGKETVD